MTSDTLDGGFGGAVATPQYAGFGKRLLAYILDFAILFVPLFGASFYLVNMAPNAIGYLLVTLLFSLYKPLLEGLYGATLGKMIVKLQVVDAEGDLGKASLTQAFMRWLPFFVAGLWTWWNQYNMISAMEAEGISGAMESAMFQQEYNAELGTVAYVAMAVSFLLPLASALFMLTNPKKQAAHDILGNTYVISTKPVETMR